MSNERTVTLRVNGREERGSFPAHRTLLEALRQIGHTEVKCGCEKGDCGACAVLVDGMAVDSCLTLAWTAEGAEITTISGLGDLGACIPCSRRSPTAARHSALLHSGDHHRRQGHHRRASGSHRGRHSPRPERQPVPLHRLHEGVRGGRRGGRRHARGERSAMTGSRGTSGRCGRQLPASRSVDAAAVGMHPGRAGR